MEPNQTQVSSSIVSPIISRLIERANGLDLLVLQAREEFKPNKNGISSMFLYHATILIHGSANFIHV